MSTQTTTIIIIIAILVVGGFLLFRNSNQFDLPEGETQPLAEEESLNADDAESVAVESDTQDQSRQAITMSPQSNREVMVTDGVKHSIPLDEILSGGPPKDGIPSIDDPTFIGADSADEFLSANSPGLGFEWKGETRFYPYHILVWHEIVNDTVQGDPILVTYCPLCATGIIFERRVDGEAQEFGVSGRLWQSNLLMYNRTGNEETESLWSQVLGEAVLGPATGEKLAVLPSDTVQYGAWKEKHPNTKVLSRDTGTVRPYGSDPYGDYYTNDTVSFGATFNDDRLPAKAFVHGIEIDGQFKAYHEDALPEGTTTDTFAGKTITVEKSEIGETEFFVGPEKEPLPSIDGFWFSWLAVHPDTELFK